AGRGCQDDAPGLREPALDGAQLLGTAVPVRAVAVRHENLVLRVAALLRVLCRLGGPLERDLGRLVATGLAQYLTAQLLSVGLRLQGECAIERQQGAILVAELVGGVAELVPD